jgi:hypothetical protein
MSENVFNIVQLGKQSGTFTAPGSAAAATFLYPVEEPVNMELDRASTFPAQDVGRNMRNRAGSGFHGLRGSTVTLASQVRYEDVMDILEMCFAGGVVPTGVGPYVWVYTFEGATPTLIPYTIEGGNTDAAQSQMRMRSCLVNSLTIGFEALTAPGAFPWTLSAEVFGFDREITALTPALAARTGLEVVQGHRTILSEGTTATAFSALTTLSNSLKSFTATFNRNLARRAYGSASDIPLSYGFTDKSNGTFEMKVAISATAKTDFHDIWNVATPAALGERRWRLKSDGISPKSFQIDLRAGILAVPYDENDGERLFSVTGELVDDDTLVGGAQITVTNSIASL